MKDLARLLAQPVMIRQNNKNCGEKGADVKPTEQCSKIDFNPGTPNNHLKMDVW